MNKAFEDLRITGLDKERCYAVDGAIVRVYLRLSAAPPPGWPYLFSNIWQSTPYPLKRNAGIEGGAIWIECVPEEVRQCHLEELEKAVSQTNVQYRSAMQQKATERMQKIEMEVTIAAQLDDLDTHLDQNGASARRKERKSRSGIRGIFSALSRGIAEFKRALREKGDSGSG